MKKLNFITIGDKNYFGFIIHSIKKIMLFYPNCKFYIYDWGFTKRQKEILSSYSITILIDWAHKIDKENGYKTINVKYEGYQPPYDFRKNEYLWNQKPICLLDCAKRIKKNLIYLDGDAFLINPIDEMLEQDFDIGVTLNSKEEFEKAKQHNFIAPLNAGVIFFICDSKSIQLFIQEWLNQIKITNKVWIEQTALGLLIEKDNKGIFRKPYNNGVVITPEKNLKVKLFPSRIYNAHMLYQGFDLNETKIIHIIRRTNLKEIKLAFKIGYIFKNFKKIFPNFLKLQIDKYLDVQKILAFILQKNKIQFLKNRIIESLLNKEISTTLSII